LLIDNCEASMILPPATKLYHYLIVIEFRKVLKIQGFPVFLFGKLNSNRAMYSTFGRAFQPLLPA